jgi:hypothetical protein
VTTRRTRNTVAATAAALSFGLGAAPAMAWPAHPWEATSPHYTSREKANAVAAAAKRKGVRTVLHVIGPHNIEVEYANGFANPRPADKVCAQVKAKGLPCIVEQEGHGVPTGWGRG